MEKEIKMEKEINNFLDIGNLKQIKEHKKENIGVLNLKCFETEIDISNDFEIDFLIEDFENSLKLLNQFFMNFFAHDFTEIRNNKEKRKEYDEEGLYEMEELWKECFRLWESRRSPKVEIYDFLDFEYPKKETNKASNVVVKIIVKKQEFSWLAYYIAGYVIKHLKLSIRRLNAKS